MMHLERAQDWTKTRGQYNEENWEHYKAGLKKREKYLASIAKVIEMAEEGNAEAQFNLGNHYLRRFLAPKAAAWFKKAAKQGHAEATKSLAEVLKKNNPMIVQAYANQGDKEALYILALRHEIGLGIPKDPEKSIKLYRMAAEQGNTDGQYKLGVIFLSGKDVKKDEKEAVKWFQLAATKGHANSQSALGFMYFNGKGVEKDSKEAVKWWRKAAEQNVAHAQFNLGVMYEYGRGVEKGFEEAVKWYRKAAGQGYQPAKSALKKISPSPPP